MKRWCKSEVDDIGCGAPLMMKARCWTSWYNRVDALYLRVNCCGVFKEARLRAGQDRHG
jgi:hypothetical protein